MKKQVILSILVSVAATVTAFSQKTVQPNVSAAPAPKEVAKGADKTTGVERADQKTAEKPSKSNEALKAATGVERADQKTAEKPGKGNDALKAATKRKMEKNKTSNQPKGTVGTATGKNERREAAQKELRELESKKKAANRPPSNSPSKAPQSAALKDSGAPKKVAPAVDSDNAQPKKKDN